MRRPIGPGISLVCGLTRPCPSDEGDPWPDLPPSRHIEIPTGYSPPTNHPDGPQKEERLGWMHQRPAKMSSASAPEAWLVPAGARPAVGLVRYGFEAGGFEALAEQVEKRVASVYDRQVQEELAALAELFLVHDAQ